MLSYNATAMFGHYLGPPFVPGSHSFLNSKPCFLDYFSTLESEGRCWGGLHARTHIRYPVPAFIVFVYYLGVNRMNHQALDYLCFWIA